MPIRLRDNQGRDWTVEGDWSARVVGADFDGRGQILVWISPDSADAYLESIPFKPADAYLERFIVSGASSALPAAEGT